MPREDLFTGTSGRAWSRENLVRPEKMSQLSKKIMKATPFTMMMTIGARKNKIVSNE